MPTAIAILTYLKIAGRRIAREESDFVSSRSGKVKVLREELNKALAVPALRLLLE